MTRLSYCAGFINPNYNLNKIHRQNNEGNNEGNRPRNETNETNSGDRPRNETIASSLQYISLDQANPTPVLTQDVSTDVPFAEVISQEEVVIVVVFDNQEIVVFASSEVIRENEHSRP